MAYTQADLDALDSAYASGAQRVELPSVGTVTYRSIEEYRRLRGQMLKDIGASSGVKPVRRVKIWSSKDL